MKSKTSCFNRTIFKKNFTHFWPLWLLYQIYLLVVIPVWVWQKAASPYYYYGTGNEDTTYRMYQLVELAVHRMIPPLPVFSSQWQRRWQCFPICIRQKAPI